MPEVKFTIWMEEDGNASCIHIQYPEDTSAFCGALIPVHWTTLESTFDPHITCDKCLKIYRKLQREARKAARNA